MQSPYRVARPRGTRSLALLVGLSVASLASTFSASAQASGFLNARYGGDYGQPAIGSPYSVHYNPAAIGETTGTNIVLDAMFGLRTAQYDRPASALSPSAGKSTTDPVYVAANTGTAKSTSIQGAPYFGITTDFGGKLPIFAGFASYVPEGGFSAYGHKTQWQNDKRAPGAYDGPQRWALVSGSQISWWNTLAVGGTIQSIRLSIGISASLVRDTLTSLIARNKDSSDDLSTATGVVTEGRSLLDVAGTHVALGAGLFWRPMEDGKLRIGVSYLSRQGLSTARLKGSLRTQFGGAADLKQDADVLMSFPDIIRFGAAFRATKQLDLRLDGEWVRWSLLKRQCVVVSGGSCNVRDDGGEDKLPTENSQILLNLDRQWRDAFGLRAGAGYFLTDDTELMGSLGFDTSAVPAAHLDATYFDAFKLIASIGVRQRFAERWVVGATLTEMYYLPVDNTGSAINNTLQIPSRSPSNAGTYKSSITFLDVNVGVRF
jgi:long-chain fatty acid transport protein